ncbi:hypothetical protein SPHV1_180013 [Novosphingobium sp. KN65.2]|nr:hypothetical protein SPHV1_180013 [Novosphingobium sp. KN65.2]
MPDILDPAWIHADQAWNDVILEIRNDSSLTSIEGAVPDSVNALVREYLKRNEVPSRARHNYPGRLNSHVGHFPRNGRLV